MLKIFKNFSCLQGQAWVSSKSTQILAHDMTLSYKLMHHHHPHIGQHMDMASRHSCDLSLHIWYYQKLAFGIVWSPSASYHSSAPYSDLRPLPAQMPWHDKFLPPLRYRTLNFYPATNYASAATLLNSVLECLMSAPIHGQLQGGSMHNSKYHRLPPILHCSSGKMLIMARLSVTVAGRLK